MRDTSLIEIDMASLDRNYRLLRQLVGGDCVVCPVVKADAYGLGAAPIARRLAGLGCELLAVFAPHEAMDLFEAGFDGRVLALKPVTSVEELSGLERAISTGHLHLTVHDRAQLAVFDSLAGRLNGPQAARSK